MEREKGNRKANNTVNTIAVPTSLFLLWGHGFGALLKLVSFGKSETITPVKHI